MKDQQILTLKEIPSKFLTYKVKEFKLRALTLGEMLYLSSEEISPRELGDLINKCLLNYEFNDLIMADAKFMAAYLGFFTDSTRMYSFKSTCKSCGEPVSKTVSAENFFESEDIDFDYPLDFESNGHKYTFGFFTYGDQVWLEELEDKSKYNDLILYPSLYLRQLDDKDLTRQEAYDALYSLDDPQSLELTAEIMSILKLKFKDVEIKCKKCGKTHSYPVDLEVSTLIPFQNYKGSVRDRIKGRKRS